MECDFNHLKILIWKNAMVKQKHFIHYGIELLFTVLWTLLIFLLFGMTGKAQTKERHDANMLRDTTEQIDNSLSKDYTICYLPDTHLAKLLMLEANNIMNLKPEQISVCPSDIFDGKNITYRVIFKNINIFKTSFPQKLEYDVEIITHYPEKSKFHWFDFGFVRSDFRQSAVSDDHESVARIQSAIDRAFIKMKTGFDIPQLIRLKKLSKDKGSILKKELRVIFITMALFILLFSLTLSLFTFASQIVSTYAYEKLSGFEEMQRMVGVSSFTLLWSHIITSIPTCFVFVTGTTLIMFNCSELLALSNSSWILIALTFLCFFVSLTIFLLFIALLFTTMDDLASNVKLIVIFASLLAAYLIFATKNMSLLISIAVFDPYLPLYITLYNTYYREMKGKGMTFDQIWETDDVKIDLSPGSCLLLYFVQFVLYFLLALYISTRGFPDLLKPFRALVKMWNAKEYGIEQDSEQNLSINNLEKSYFENVERVEALVTVSHISKIYKVQGKNIFALRDVNINIYDKMITVILGHNGCGKTTLMSILTGMIKPTTGEILIQGKKNSNRKVRKFIGYCSQNEISHRSLNVLQHMMFFGMLKGLSYRKSIFEAKELLSILNIPDKSKALPSELSGGMLRRLQLACAMSGGSRLLVLDEPSSGLDMQSRRELWDVIMELRKKRTIFLSTHYLEEADALADNVAILHQGMIVAFASPMHLKHAVGLGFHLSMHMEENYSLENITKAVTSKIPDAVLTRSTNNNVVFILPSKHSNMFVPLFQYLETQKQELGIVSLSVGETSLEDAFLKIINIEAIEDINIKEDKLLLHGSLSLILQQVYVLLIRQLKFLRFKIISFVLLDVLLTVLLIYLFTPKAHDENKDIFRRSLSDIISRQIIEPGSKSIYYNVGDNYKHFINNMQINSPEYKFIKSDDIVRDTHRTANTGSENILGGIYLNDTHAEIYYSSSDEALTNTMNILFNTIGNMFMRTYSGDDVFKVNLRSEQNQPDDSKKIWSVMLACVSSIKLISLLKLPFRERTTGARQSHILAGCSIYTYWLTTYLFHIIFYTILIQTPAIICLKLITKVDDFIGTFYVVSLLHALSTLPFIYVFTQFGKSKSRISLILDVLVIFSGLFTPLVVLYTEGYQTKFITIIKTVSFPMPMYHYPMALYYTKKKFSQRMPMHTLHNAADIHRKHIMTMIAEAIIYWIFLILLEHNFITTLYSMFVDRSYVPPIRIHFDKQVLQEELEVKEKIAHGGKNTKGASPDIHLTYNLHKCYKALSKFKVYALKGISLGIKRGEILGFLGVNGSGKSTTFNMFTGQIAKLRGQLYSNGYSIGFHSYKYLSSIVYCPQFGGVDDYLGIYDNLLITCVLKGIPLIEAYNIAREWSNMSRANHIVPVHLLSGGERRHCTTLATLAASRHIALLDEPTAGVDVVARRTIWKALTSMNKTIVLSSHSMEETEALCSRIAILSQGELVALATPIQLRTERANGFNVTLQLNFNKEATDAWVVERMNVIKIAFYNAFQCRVIDEHQTILRFHVSMAHTYSQLFASVEEFKIKYPEIVFYTVNETSLEEVFMAVVREDEEAS